MIVAGGCYYELCEHPFWRAVYGSGGRAAAAVAGLCPNVELKTYYPSNHINDLSHIQDLGVQIEASDSPTRIAFAYFHALSDPIMAPSAADIAIGSPIRVEGDVILRFGFVEGTAIVKANRAVYDPQSASSFEPFKKNGSRASELAVVLNERELCGPDFSITVEDAARRVLSNAEASVLLVKGGIKGARLFTAPESSFHIPAYQSARIFKIGTGDIFSAAFTYYWGVRKMDAHSAAVLASRSVAEYCGTGRLPLPTQGHLSDLDPVGSLSLRPVCIAGSARALGARWMLEEARWRLQQLGLRATAPALGDANFDTSDLSQFGCLLALADHLDEAALELIEHAAASGLPAIAFRQLCDSALPQAISNAKVTDDFTTAIYWACWAAAQQ